MYTPNRSGVGSYWSDNALSVNLNLFFLRIMKEHSLFLEAGFTPKDKKLATRAEEFKENFDTLLMQTIAIANGIVSRKAMESGQFVTPFTAQSERLTSHFTGIPIDSNITVREGEIRPAEGKPQIQGVEDKIKAINEKSRRLTGELKDFKKKLLSDSVNNRIFTSNYPAELHHMYREAEHYLKTLDALIENKNIMTADKTMPEEAFWNEIMAEHNKSAAGKLDPTEKDLIEKSQLFAKEFEGLTSRAKIALLHLEPKVIVTRDSRNTTKQLQDFQMDGLRGVLKCDIQTIIHPLRLDHRIRETAYFIWLLDMDEIIRRKTR